MSCVNISEKVTSFAKYQEMSHLTHYYLSFPRVKDRQNISKFGQEFLSMELVMSFLNIWQFHLKILDGQAVSAGGCFELRLTAQNH